VIGAWSWPLTSI